MDDNDEDGQNGQGHVPSSLASVSPMPGCSRPGESDKEVCTAPATVKARPIHVWITQTFNNCDFFYYKHLFKTSVYSRKNHYVLVSVISKSYWHVKSTEGRCSRLPGPPCSLHTHYTYTALATVPSRRYCQDGTVASPLRYRQVLTVP